MELSIIVFRNKGRLAISLHSRTKSMFATSKYVMTSEIHLKLQEKTMLRMIP